MGDKKKVKVSPVINDDGRREIVKLLIHWTSGRQCLNQHYLDYHYSFNVTSDEHESWHGLFNGDQIVNRRGKIAKRLRSTLRQELGYKLTPPQMSQIGNIAANNSSAGGEFLFELDDVINMKQGEFSDSDSCFFVEYGSGNRFYNRLAMHHDPEKRFQVMKVYEARTERPLSRAFVFTASDGATLVFNAYGALSRVKMASVLSTSNNWPASRKTQFESDVYINAGIASAIGGEKGQKHYSIYLDTNQYRAAEYMAEYEEYDEDYISCEHCGDRVHEDDARWPEGGDGGYCEHCYDDIFTYCEMCESEYDVNWTSFYSVQGHRYYDYVCENCHSEHFSQCAHCSEDWHNDKIDKVDGHVICEDCVSDCGECAICEERYYPIRHSENEREYCHDCMAKHADHNLRENESACPDCFTATKNSTIIIMCQDCRNGLHFDCDDCRDHPLHLCADHYAKINYGHQNAAIQNLNFTFGCDRCNDWTAEAIRHDGMSNDRGAFFSKTKNECLPCFSESVFRPLLGEAQRWLDSTSIRITLATAAAEYLDAVAYLGLNQAYSAEYANLHDSVIDHVYRYSFQAQTDNAQGAMEYCQDNLDEFLTNVTENADMVLDIITKASASRQMILNASDNADILNTLVINPYIYGRNSRRESAHGDYGSLYLDMMMKHYALDGRREELGDIIHAISADHIGQDDAADIYHDDYSAIEYTCNDAVSQPNVYGSDDYYTKRVDDAAARLDRLETRNLCHVIRRGHHSILTTQQRADALRLASKNVRSEACQICTMSSLTNCRSCEYAAPAILAAAIDILPSEIALDVDSLQNRLNHSQCLQCGSHGHWTSGHYCSDCQGFCPSGVGNDGRCNECNEKHYNSCVQQNRRIDLLILADNSNRDYMTHRQAIDTAIAISDQLTDSFENALRRATRISQDRTRGIIHTANRQALRQREASSGELLAWLTADVGDTITSASNTSWVEIGGDGVPETEDDAMDWLMQLADNQEFAND